MNIKSENVINEFNRVVSSIPENITPLEKVRWIYIKLGELFCYDYTFIDSDESNFSYDLNSGFLSRFQTCVEISHILNDVLNNIDGVESKIVERRVNLRGIYDHEHLANLIKVDGKEYLLDLTLDLFLIQSGCRTGEFAYSVYDDNTELIPHVDTDEMDKKLGLMNNGQYLDDSLNEMYYRLRKIDFSHSTFEEELNYRLETIKPYIVKFHGFQEAKNFLNRVLNGAFRFSRGDTFFREFNLRNNDIMVTAYAFTRGEENIWLLFDPSTGISRITPDYISNMLQDGWTTRSQKIYDYLDGDIILS